MELKDIVQLDDRSMRIRMIAKVLEAELKHVEKVRNNVRKIRTSLKLKADL